MLNISQNSLIEVPFTDGGKVVKLNGKPVILKVSPVGSTAHRNLAAEVERLGVKDEKERVLMFCTAMLNGCENLMDGDKPVDCSKKKRLKELLDGEENIQAQIIKAATEKKPWTLEDLKPTQESSAG